MKYLLDIDPKHSTIFKIVLDVVFSLAYSFFYSMSGQI